VEHIWFAIGTPQILPLSCPDQLVTYHYWDNALSEHLYTCTSIYICPAYYALPEHIYIYLCPALTSMIMHCWNTSIFTSDQHDNVLMKHLYINLPLSSPDQHDIALSEHLYIYTNVQHDNALLQHLYINLPLSSPDQHYVRRRKAVFLAIHCYFWWSLLQINKKSIVKTLFNNKHQTAHQVVSLLLLISHSTDSPHLLSAIWRSRPQPLVLHCFLSQIDQPKKIQSTKKYISKTDGHSPQWTT
jgi:hypothetical protein